MTVSIRIYVFFCGCTQLFALGEFLRTELCELCKYLQGCFGHGLYQLTFPSAVDENCDFSVCSPTFVLICVYFFILTILVV